MSSMRCEGCNRRVHDIDEHLESASRCRPFYPDITEELVDLGLIDPEN